ncbi:MAG: HNH endonuclease [Dermatophilaceae bacterium]
MPSSKTLLAASVSTLEAARTTLAGVGEVLHHAGGAELSTLLSLVDEVAAAAEAARARVVAEAVGRGEVSLREARGWVTTHAPSLRQAGASPLARLVREVAEDGGQTALTTAAVTAELHRESPVGMVWSQVCEGALAPRSALAVLGEVRALERRLASDAVPTVTGALIELVREHGTATMRRLRPRLLAEHGAPGELGRLQERLAPGAHLSTPWVRSADLTEYALALTPEQAATVEAAIGPLAAPRPNEVTGERDLRPAGQRRAEALAEVCRRGADLGGAENGPAESSSAVHVTIAVGDLERRTGCGEVIGSIASGTVIAPESLRRIACDAALIPYVLGSAGEIIDQGRAVRLFTRAQRRRLWLRDGGCSYPGCHLPAAWCRAHHVQHWADGGASDLGNAALLCSSHHTLVHQRRLWAQVHEKSDGDGRHVIWNLRPGSYDDAMHAIRERDRRHSLQERRRAQALDDAHRLPEVQRAIWQHHDDLDAWYATDPETMPCDGETWTNAG